MNQQLGLTVTKEAAWLETWTDLLMYRKAQWG